MKHTCNKILICVKNIGIAFQVLPVIYQPKNVPKTFSSYLFIRLCIFESELQMGLILKPKTGPSPTFTFEARFSPKDEFTEWVKICATARYQKT